VRGAQLATERSIPARALTSPAPIARGGAGGARMGSGRSAPYPPELEASGTKSASKASACRQRNCAITAKLMASVYVTGRGASRSSQRRASEWCSAGGPPLSGGRTAWRSDAQACAMARSRVSRSSPR
jgi:hypothetical protein